MFQNIDASTKRILGRTAIDLVIIVSLITINSLLFAHGIPFKRGFFCGDESLMHPYRDSTVPTNYLLFIAFGLPLIVILISELICFKFNVQENRKLKLFNRDFPIEAVNVIKHYGVCLFGLSVTVLITNIGKLSLGRLRPHFIDVCRPIMVDGTNCSELINSNRYIEDFSCGNVKATKFLLDQMRLSFPSGHSSMSMFSMFFIVFYIHHKMTWRGSTLLKHSLQICFVIVALFTALSRISDYKHHWSDVLAGSLLGVSTALITVYSFSNIATKKKTREEENVSTIHSSTSRL